MITKQVQNLLMQWGWTIVVLFVCIGIYERGNAHYQGQITELQSQLAALKEEIAVAIKKREMLARKVNSQSDPWWVELTLLKGLGLVPEGQSKFIFAEKNQASK